MLTPKQIAKDKVRGSHTCPICSIYKLIVFDVRAGSLYIKDPVAVEATIVATVSSVRSCPIKLEELVTGVAWRPDGVRIIAMVDICVLPGIGNLNDLKNLRTKDAAKGPKRYAFQVLVTDFLRSRITDSLPCNRQEDSKSWANEGAHESVASSNEIITGGRLFLPLSFASRFCQW